MTWFVIIKSCECLCLVGPLVCIITWIIAKAVVSDPLYVTYTYYCHFSLINFVSYHFVNLQVNNILEFRTVSDF